jgi:hypothetical protein
MDVTWADAFVSIAVGIALAAAAGLRVFVPLLVLGGAARFGGLPLSSGFDWLASTQGLAALSLAVVLEIGAYYVPWVDNLLDTVASPLAVISGALAVAAVTTELPPPVRWALAVVGGGGAAGVVQGLTSFARLKSTAVTGGVANPILATLELFGSFAISIVAIVLPLLAIVIVASFVVLIRAVAARLFRRKLNAS